MGCKTLTYLVTVILCSLLGLLSVLCCHRCRFCRLSSNLLTSVDLRAYPRSLLISTIILTLSVCVSWKLQIDSSFLFLYGIEPFFWPSVLHDPFYKTLFFDFSFRPPSAQNVLPKICTKLPISRLVWQTDWICLGLQWGFWGWPIQWKHAKCCGADPCCHGNEIWARRGDPSPTGLCCLFVHMLVLVTTLHSASVCMYCH